MSAPDDREQSFLSHLVELRQRLLKAVVAVGAFALVLLPFSGEIYTLMSAPLLAQLPEGTSMVAVQVASPFLTPFKMAILLALFLAMPAVLYQLWAFVAPGLYPHEKKITAPVLVSACALFYLGCLFAYFVVFPLAFAFFAAVAPEGVAFMPDISHYLDFMLVLFFAFGIAFEVPIVVFILISAGVTTPEALSKKRPYVIVGAFAVGMLLTPPDVISQTLLAVPMWLLYEGGIVISKILLKPKPEPEPEPDDRGLDP